MKYYIAVILCIFSISLANAQDNTIKNLETRIEAAVLEEDYAKADNLKKQKEIHIQIEEALTLEDYAKAAELKEKLKALEGSKSTTKASSNVSESVRSEDRDHYILNNGFFIDGLFGVKPSSPNYTLAYGTIGIKVGNKWYFGNGTVYRPGIQATWVRNSFMYNANLSVASIEISPVGIGFSNLIAFNDKIGLEANISTGFSVFLENLDNAYQYNGFNVTPEVKFRYKRMAIGLEFHNGYYFDPNFGYAGSVNTYSLSLGGKF